MEGRTSDLLVFDEGISEGDALAVCVALRANPDCLLIGSDSGYDEGAPEEDDEVVL